MSKAITKVLTAASLKRRPCSITFAANSSRI